MSVYDSLHTPSYQPFPSLSTCWNNARLGTRLPSYQPFPSLSTCCNNARLGTRLPSYYSIFLIMPFLILIPLFPFPFSHPTSPALVSRCLQTLVLLLPDIRKHFQLRLAIKQHILLTHFDQVSEVTQLLPHVRVTKCVLSANVLVCRLGLVREAL